MSGSTYPYYVSPAPGQVAAKPEAPLAIEPAPREGLDSPDRYYADDDLQAAVNAALLLGQPLLVTGRPGCGKTQLGRAVAYSLGYQHFKFDTKSTSLAKDLFYLFDIVGRFQAHQFGGSSDPRDFIHYQALGLAILLSHPRDRVKAVLPKFGDHDFLGDENAVLAKDWGQGLRSVVVIDEVDKAPRDFPNDILNEIEQLSFSIAELGGTRVPPPPTFRPFVVFTSNSEKQLPDAFLRRCVYYHIEEPKKERLLDIVKARLGADRFGDSVATQMRARFGLDSGDALVESAIGLFTVLREGGEVSLKKPPGIAELLNWLVALAGMGAEHNKKLSEQQGRLVERSLTVLLKFKEDRDTVVGRDSVVGGEHMPRQLAGLLAKAEA